MILRSNTKRSSNNNGTANCSHPNTNPGVHESDNVFATKICNLMDRYEKRLVRIECALKQISEALNVDQESSNSFFLKNDLNSEGWMHEYTYGTRLYHAGYHGHVIKETRLRVIFQTLMDEKQVALSVMKSDVGRDGQFTLYQQIE